MKKTKQTLATAAMFAAAAVSSLSVSAQEAPLYGPPPVGKALGDINQDMEIDVRDVTLLKQLLLRENGVFYLMFKGDRDKNGRIEEWEFPDDDPREFYLGDLNQDRTVDKADVQEIIRRLTGAPKEEEEPIVTTMTVETEVEMTSQTAYGPPPAWH